MTADFSLALTLCGTPPPPPLLAGRLSFQQIPLFQLPKAALTPVPTNNVQEFNQFPQILHKFVFQLVWL